jgi:hypothetical protein
MESFFEGLVVEVVLSLEGSRGCADTALTSKLREVVRHQHRAGTELLSI